MMITFTEDNLIFSCRVAGILLHNNKVLFHKPTRDNFWALPGGRAELFETSEETIVREFEEEINEKVTVNRLLWVVENFFQQDNKKYHELSFYYLVELEKDSIITKQDEFFGVEVEKKMIFKWVDINEFDKIIIKPDFLTKGLKNIPQNIEKIINNELYSFQNLVTEK